MKSDRITQFSTCRRWRYTLWREWQDDMFDVHDKYLMVIGLNPSTADETKDDPTIRRCIGFAKRWGYGALCMTNLFAWRDTKPESMKKAVDPIGPDNDRYLAECAAQSGAVLAAWGRHGSHLNRADAVVKFLPHVLCLRLNSDGSPQHPLYVPAETVPFPLCG